MYYTEPKIKQTNGRWYVYFLLTDNLGNKKPFKIYNGNNFGVEGRGNYNGASTKYKQMYFGDLRNRVSNALSTGWYPGKESDTLKVSVFNAIRTTSDMIEKSRMNDVYKKNLIQLSEKLRTHFEQQKNHDSKQVFTSNALKSFLNSYTTGVYFNNQKAHLSAFFTRMLDLGIIESNPMKAIPKLKAKPMKNVAFTDSQIDELFSRLKDYNKHLFLMAVIMYQTLLRPHIEIRHLKRGYFTNDFSRLIIPNGYTKNSRGRNIPVTNYLSSLLKDMEIANLEDDQYVFGKLFNPSYFSTLWRKFILKNPNLLKKDQTIYSIRHSAALNIYNKTKSVQKVRLAMDHQDIATTYTYLRSLDIYEDVIVMTDLPDIDMILLK